MYPLVLMETAWQESRYPRALAWAAGELKGGPTYMGFLQEYRFASNATSSGLKILVTSAAARKLCASLSQPATTKLAAI